MTIAPYPAMTARLLYRGRLASVTTWRCGSLDTAPGAEEACFGNELVFTRRGSFKRVMRKESVVADPTSVLFFPRHETYRVGHPAPGGDAGVVLSIAKELLEEIGSPAGPGTGRLGPAQALDLHRLMAILGSADGRAARTPSAEIEERVLLLAGDAMPRPARRRPAGRVPWRGPFRDGTRSARTRSIERVKLLLASGFQEPLRLPAIGREAACSPYHLCRIFREETGETIHRHLNRVRLLQALDRLEPGVDLASLALDVGFSSHSHFSSAFRREFGLPPSSVARGAARPALLRIRKNLKALLRRPS